MKINGQLNGMNVELDRPDIIKQDGVWYEAIEYRPVIRGKVEWFLNKHNNLVADVNGTSEPYWIMRPIPRATPDQLKAVGMRELYLHPVKIKHGDCVWVENNGGREHHCITWTCSHVGKYGWVLVPAAKEAAHFTRTTFQRKIDKMKVAVCEIGNNRIVLSWGEGIVDSHTLEEFMREFELAPAPAPAPMVNRHGIEIEQDEPRYTITQINNYISDMRPKQLDSNGAQYTDEALSHILRLLHHRQFGIAATINKKENHV